MHIHEGVWAREFSIKLGQKVNRVQVLFDWSQAGQHHHSILHLNGGLNSCRTQDIILLYISHEEELKIALPLHHCLTAFSLFLLSLCSLRSLITETCLEWKSIAARRGLWNGLGPNGFFYVHSSSVYNRQDMEITCPLNIWMNRDVVCVCVCDGILAIKRMK